MSYAPQEMPQTSVKDLARAITEELKAIGDEMIAAKFDTINLAERNASLAKPRDGDVVNADGTNFNPGSGKGIYYFNGTIYVKLG